MKFLIVKLPAVLIEMVLLFFNLVNGLCRERSKSNSQNYCRKCLTGKQLYRSSTAVQILTILFPCIFSNCASLNMLFESMRFYHKNLNLIGERAKHLQGW